MTLLPPDSRPPVFAAHDEVPPTALYIALGPDQAVKVGTCAHCVAGERGRPANAWDTVGDNDLDFARDLLFGYLEELGIQIVERQAYVCP